MIIIMSTKATTTEIDGVVKRLEDRKVGVHMSQGAERTIIGVIGDRELVSRLEIEGMEGVERTVSILQPFKLVSREFHPENTIIDVGGVKIGGEEIVVIAGPCAVENEKQLIESAWIAKTRGAKILRGGAFKPRTSPYSFQGLEEEGLKLLSKAREETGLKVISEVVNPRDVDLVASYVDIIQIGARNMQNFTLLREVGKLDKPVMLKRGMSATIEEWLMAAEYILAEGNHQVMFCERGIRTFETYTRNTMDISAVPLVKRLSHLPVIVDPSHGTGKWSLVSPMSKAAVAAGADGLMIEVHNNPQKALSDGPQSLNDDNFASLMQELVSVIHAIGRTCDFGDFLEKEKGFCCEE